MSDEPSLPRLPAVSWDEHSQTFSNNPRKRVRAQRSRYSPSIGYNSSDPAVFSSDDDPGLDNYVEGRRKKRYVGSWFQQQPASSDSAFSDAIVIPKGGQKRTLARQVDSGVFLGSDGTDGEDLAEELELPTRSRLPQLLDKSQARRVSEAELAVRDKIRACLDGGIEQLDFWQMGLEELSSETISPLGTFECIPVVAKDVSFEQKDPELEMYLAMNRLRSLPGALFDLTHLTILSLRGNKLTELPPAICRLRNLRELNISQNRLRYLPAELLDLMQPESKLCSLVLHPNAFYEPEEPFSRDLDDEYLSRGEAQPSPRFVSVHRGRSPLQICDSRGETLSEFRLPSDQTVRKIPLHAGGPDELPPSSQTAAATRRATSRPSVVPSLVEAALLSCSSSSQLADLEYYIPDGLPQLRQLLRRAARQKDAGGVGCSQCRRPAVVPRLEWLEWRDLGTYESVEMNGEEQSWRMRPLSMAEHERAVPFLHRGCSWGCGPDR
ncbi:leucine rich repeat domain-containingprotein [Purpureocillium lavendulum]|uniref:Leucine rich repeat domain-containingprotein n=1 Tax=Purpureocillium lavendulum TaxID=1247861 RepID=A0AB34G612_9HYPO|nr:leucine rich repeat domain-containingprotein [Purpureocillium lavendulum]